MTKQEQAIVESVCWSARLMTKIHDLKDDLEDNADIPHADEENHIQKQYMKLWECLRETEQSWIIANEEPYYQDSSDDTGRTDSKV